jgi:hypothetical protein
MGRELACMGEKKSAYKVFAEKHEGKKSVGRYRRRLELNIKMDLKGIGWGAMGWIHLARDGDQW